jgi:hypothetical protein
MSVVIKNTEATRGLLDKLYTYFEGKPKNEGCNVYITYELDIELLRDTGYTPYFISREPTDNGLGNGTRWLIMRTERNVYVLTTNTNHYNHVVETLQELNPLVKFKQVHRERDILNRHVDYIIAYDISGWCGNEIHHTLDTLVAQFKDRIMYITYIDKPFRIPYVK